MAKFQKLRATPANAVKVNSAADKKSNGVKRAGGGSTGAGDRDEDEDEVVDRTPIAADEEEGGEEDGFGGFDDDEDREYMDRARRNAMRRRGLDPKALNQKGPKKGKETKE